jgi:hypothetical protein
MNLPVTFTHRTTSQEKAMEEESKKLMDSGYELASYFVDHAMDKTNNNGMVASLALGMAYASLMSANRIDETKAIELVRGVYQRAARLEELMGGSRETH